MPNVPDVCGRVRIDAATFHCGTVNPVASYPKTTYAASALIDVALDPEGTANVIAWTGPRKSLMGVEVVVTAPTVPMLSLLAQVSGKTSDGAMSTLGAGDATVHVVAAASPALLRF
jgi:hypothetical protein